MRLTSKQVQTLSLLVMTAALSMGNESCQKAQGRVLKMDVELSAIKGRSIRLPTGEVVDFPFAVNQHFYRQVIKNDHFVIINSIPSSNSANLSNSTGLSSKASSSEASTADSDYSSEDIDVINKYGFLDPKSDESAKDQVESTEEGLSQKSTNSEVVTKLPICLYDMPQAYLSGDVLSFEASWGAGLSLGYTANGNISAGDVAGGVDFSNSKLELGLRTDDPLTQEVQVIADGIAHQSNVKFRFDFLIGLGLDFFFNESISSVIQDGLDEGLQKIVEGYIKRDGSWENTWESRVVYEPKIADNDTHFAIRGGKRAGIQIGDEFQIRNMHYMWEGAECYTRLKDKIAEPGSPVVNIKIIEVGDNIAVGVQSDPDATPDVRIKPGALVKLLKLYVPPTTTTAGTTTTAAK